MRYRRRLRRSATMNDEGLQDLLLSLAVYPFDGCMFAWYSTATYYIVHSCFSTMYRKSELHEGTHIHVCPF